MCSWLKKWPGNKTVLTSVLSLAGSFAQAQQPCPPLPPCCPTPNYPYYIIPGAPGAPGAEGASQPGTVGQPGGSGTEGAGTAGTSFAGLGAGAGVGSSVALDPGYIDIAVPRTQVRVRYDSFYRDNRPDRAEFFYPKCGCFLTPDAKGPPLPERSVDAQEAQFYLEYAPWQRFSGFIEMPIRWINPEVNANNYGVSDINFGFKYAVVYCPDQVLTLQLRTFAPTGDPVQGLGTSNRRVEPAALYQRQLTDRLSLLAEFRDTIPVEANSDFAGQVLRYGVGLSFLAYESCRFQFAPITEVVGWTVLNGKEFTPDGAGVVKDAAGDTIVNAKFGTRVLFGDHSDLYLGYGRALTGTVWYKDIIRAEFRYRF